MKIVQVLHGYPPELHGGTELSVQALARGLAAAGHEVVVVAGSMDWHEGFRVSAGVDAPPDGGPPVRVLRIHRADAYFDHWQKGAHPQVARAFREILRAERPDLVHVHHWIRLTRDLVASAARESVPAVVSLHDYWTTCLIAFRLRPGTGEFCEAPLGPDPCLACAGQVPPFTPWRDAGELRIALAARQRDLARELELARAVLAPSRAHARSVEGFLGRDAGALGISVLPLGRDLALAAREPLPPPRAMGETGRVVLGSWGNLGRLKGADILIDALRRVREPERYELHLAGGESEAGFLAELRERAAGLAVHFHPAFDQAQLASHPVTAVHVMVSGSRARESWGLVLDEAVCLGLPVVLPRSGAFTERVAEGAGALFYEPRDADALAAVLDRLWAEPELVETLRARLPDPEEICPSVADHVARAEAIYAGAAAAGAPEIDEQEWFEARLAAHEIEQWDRALGGRTAEELGLGP